MNVLILNTYLQIYYGLNMLSFKFCTMTYWDIIFETTKHLFVKYPRKKWIDVNLDLLPPN